MPPLRSKPTRTSSATGKVRQSGRAGRFAVASRRTRHIGSRSSRSADALEAQWHGKLRRQGKPADDAAAVEAPVETQFRGVRSLGPQPHRACQRNIGFGACATGQRQSAHAGGHA